MALRDKYNAAVQTAKSLGMQGSADERDGKLYIHGTVTSEDQKNRIWDAIKTVPEWRNEVVGDIRVTAPAASAAAGTAGTATARAVAPQRSHTVQPGDTLSKIARQYLGDANAYMQIFEANRDQLANPDLIKPGQVLKIPG